MHFLYKVGDASRLCYLFVETVSFGVYFHTLSGCPRAVVPLTDDAEIASIILIVLLSGTALAAIALWPVFCKYARKNFDVEAPGSPTVPLSVCAFVYAVLFSVMAYLETPVLTAVMGQDPFVW